MYRNRFFMSIQLAGKVFIYNIPVGWVEPRGGQCCQSTYRQLNRKLLYKTRQTNQSIKDSSCKYERVNLKEIK